MTEEQERAVLLNGRYLDAEGKPILYGAGAVPAGDGATAPPPEAGPLQPLDLSVFGLEYKRLPVRMVLRMDQRWLPHLISVCASQPLQVEVQEVRINPPEFSGLEEGASSVIGGPGGGFGGERGPGGGGDTFTFPDEPPQQPFPTNPEIVNVVIQGTIYIFNKPSPAILQPTEEQPPQPLATTP
jgi:hypothetical protein